MVSSTEAAPGQFKKTDSQNAADSKALISCSANALLEKKAKDIVLLDVRGLTTLTDYFLICHGTSETHIKALANHVLDQVREKLGEKAWKQEGLDTRRWVILDYVNIVLHIFNEDKRSYYGIERMWNDAEKTVITNTYSENE
ncbi:MAG: ribosome silencing factor [Balneolaceae bacterium]